MVPIRYNIRSVIERRATSLMTILGVALVAMIFVIVFGFAAGLNQSLLNAGQDRNVIVMARGVTTENESFVPHQAVEILRVRPEIAASQKHQPLISRESIAGVNVSRTRGAKEFALLRGVEPIAYEVHPNLHLVQGHWPLRGNGEWVVGRRLLTRFPYLQPGTTFHYEHRDWKIVGVFADNDSARESEAWTDLDDLINNFHWDAGGAAALHLVLNPGSAAQFAQAIKSDGRMTLQAETETEYYAEQAALAGQLRMLGLIVALSLAIGAMFGGMNTMYTAVTRRGREIGVLRVLGFSRADILGSFVIESVILGLAGGVTGVVLATAVAWATGLTSRTMNVGAMFFSYRPTAGAIVAGVVVAAIIGVVGGLMPALRASRVGIISALREA
ncbi:MAG TPA: FtsX-like permease family protein [Candidatus Limnocylindrales bacterium]|nr:FtsX-like permease family protein [Candidatus Limnocylindrales bacterium]